MEELLPTIFEVEEKYSEEVEELKELQKLIYEKIGIKTPKCAREGCEEDAQVIHFMTVETPEGKERPVKLELVCPKHFIEVCSNVVDEGGFFNFLEDLKKSIEIVEEEKEDE